MEIIKSAKISGVGYHPTLWAPRNTTEEFNRFIAEFYPAVGLREELQKRINEANVGTVRVTWNDDWLRLVDAMTDAIEKENAIQQAVSNFLSGMREVEAERQRRSKTEVFECTFGPREGSKGSLVETLPLPSGGGLSYFQQSITKTNLQPVSQRSINQERVN